MELHVDEILIITLGVVKQHVRFIIRGLAALTINNDFSFISIYMALKVFDQEYYQRNQCDIQEYVYGVVGEKLHQAVSISFFHLNKLLTGSYWYSKFVTKHDKQRVI